MHKIRKDFDLGKLNEVSIDISDLKITYQIWVEGGRTGLLLKIAGKYGHGSDGADDAKYIRWKIREIFDHPDIFINGMVVDLSEFEYEWGDDIDIDPPKFKVPFLVFLNKESQGKYSYFVETDKMRFHLRTALAEINDEIKKI